MTDFNRALIGLSKNVSVFSVRQLFQPQWPVETSKVDTNPVYVDPVYVEPPVVPEPPSTTPVVPSSGDHDPSKKTPSRTSFFAQPGTLAGKL